MLIKITTGKPVSDHALALHRHTVNTRWSLCRKHSGFPRSRGSLPSLQRTPIENDDKGGEALFPVRQHSVLDKMRCQNEPFPLSFIVQGGRGITTRVHHLYSLSLRIEIRFDFLANKYVLPRIFTSADLHLTMYNASKLVPACKGWFMLIIHGFLLGMVFSMTLFGLAIHLRVVRG